MSTPKINPVEPPAHTLPSTVVKDDEPILVAAAKAGDISAFETLVGRYERKIFRLAQNITQNREDAEDAMQESFLKAFEHLGEFQGNSRFYTWLVRIAVNQALMKLRKRRPIKSRSTMTSTRAKSSSPATWKIGDLRPKIATSNPNSRAS